MSFPRLALTGDVGKRKITAIGVTYDNDTILTKPAYLTRSAYHVKRETRLTNVSGATPKRHPDWPYNSVRLHHTWVGYIDVLTESVSITASSTLADSTNVALLKTAWILQATQGVDHTIASFALDTSVLGPDKASLDGAYTRAYEQGVDWTYNIEKSGGSFITSSVDYWFIRDTKITDNGNNTSRVTFTLEIIEPWEDIPTVINELTP